MASIRIVLDPEAEGGLGPEFERGFHDKSMIHLGDDAEVVISGLRDGMTSGKPSMAFGFVLPDGKPVLVETSWRLFAMAFHAFAAKFGEEKPDTVGMAVEYDATGSGHRVHLDVIPDDQQPFFECEICGKSYRPEETGEEGSLKVTQWAYRHYREDHPGKSGPA